MRNIYLLSFLFMLGAQPMYSQTGHWKFDDSAHLLKATTGTDLALTGTHTSIDGPTSENRAVRIGTGSYYKALHGIAPNGAGRYVNQYTVVADIRIPASARDWKAIFNANVYNANPAECFISPEGKVGVASTGYSDYQLLPQEWYRLVISIDLGVRHTYYLDGKLIKQGTPQGVDGSFSLDPDILFFADKNGEDGLLDVAELSIYDKALTKEQVVALGGYGHQIDEDESAHHVYPYLQLLSSSSVAVSWHGDESTSYQLKYGLSPEELSNSKVASSQVITLPYVWHTAKLADLNPGTVYYYQIEGNELKSDVHSFKTLPVNDDKEKIRFLIVGDTQDNPEKNKEIVKEALAKVKTKWGDDLSQALDMVVHVGDLVGSGSTVSQYSDQFFTPFAPFTASVPTYITAGNHELEHSFYYKYIMNDDISGQPSTHSDFERYWSKQIGNTLFIGLNSTDQPSLQHIFTEQKAWLKQVLDKAEADEAIDFVFCFIHAPGMSELWGEGRHAFTAQSVFPLLQQYRKVQQLTSGHVHGYERGMLQKQEASWGDMSLLIAGGGGGARDRWGEYTNVDYQEMHTSLEHHFFVLCEIDVRNKSYQFTTYSLGNKDYPLSAVAIDTWSRNLAQKRPVKPVAERVNRVDGVFELIASPFEGEGKLFSSEFELQVKDGTTTQWNKCKKSLRDCKNIYGRDASYAPVDKNAAVKLQEWSVDLTGLDLSKEYRWAVRYRDDNQTWSEWSDFRELGSLASINGAPYPDSYSIEYTKQGLLKVKGLVGTLYVMDYSGNKLMEAQLTTNESHFPCLLPSGIYLVNVANVTKKIVIH